MKACNQPHCFRRCQAAALACVLVATVCLTACLGGSKESSTNAMTAELLAAVLGLRGDVEKLSKEIAIVQAKIEEVEALKGRVAALEGKLEGIDKLQARLVALEEKKVAAASDTSLASRQSPTRGPQPPPGPNNAEQRPHVSPDVPPMGPGTTTLEIDLRGR